MEKNSVIYTDKAGLLENLPAELQKEGYFCLWKIGDKGKIPVNPNYFINNLADQKLYFGKSNNKEYFNSFSNTLKHTSNNYGIGIGIFNQLCAIDLDHCLQNEQFTEEEFSSICKEIVEELQSYTEKSPSKTGLHVFFKLKDMNISSEDFKNKYYINKRFTQYGEGKGIEIYPAGITNKFLTITGNRFNDYTFREISFSKLQTILEKYMKKETFENIKTNEKIQNTNKNQNIVDTNEKTDFDYLTIGLEKDQTLIDFLSSIPSGKGGNESETDLAIMTKLAYWTNKNIQLMKETFESSFYYQNKNDYHKKKWNRKDYQELTINKALQNPKTAKEEDNQKIVYNQKNEQKTEQPKEEIVFHSVFDKIESFLTDSRNGRFIPVSTGFNNLDRETGGGLQKQSLAVIGGGSAMGKTTLAMNLALNFAKQNKKILYYSLEMSEEQMQAKIISNVLYNETRKKISSDRLFRLYDYNVMTEESQKQNFEPLKERKDLSNMFVMHGKNQLNDLIADIKKKTAILKEQNEEVILIIDYLQFIKHEKSDVQQTIKETTSFLKKYAIENDSIVIVLCANNRESTKEGQKTVFAGGRDSSDIEYSSDYNFQINFREWEEGNEKDFTSMNDLKNRDIKEISLTIHKSRMGKSGQHVNFIFNGETNTFEEMEEKTTRNFQLYR